MMLTRKRPYAFSLKAPDNILVEKCFLLLIEGRRCMSICPMLTLTYNVIPFIQFFDHSVKKKYTNSVNYTKL